MKRITALFLALVLAAFAPALSEAYTGDLAQTFTTDYYTLMIPEDYVIFPGDEAMEDNYQNLGTIESPEDEGLVIEAVLLYYEDMTDISLWDLDEQDTQDYIKVLLDQYSDDNPEYLTTLQAGAIPIVVIRAEDEYGVYYYAETMTHGYALAFYFYVANLDDDNTYDITEADWNLTEAILMSFEPVL